MVEQVVQLKGALSSTDKLRSTSGIPFKQRETESGDYIYYGIAMRGTATSDAGWRIFRENTTNDDVDLAPNFLDFGDIWDNVLSLDYD